MTLQDDRRLYDVSTRVQVYVECVKQYQQAQLNQVLGDLSLQIVALLQNVKYKTLDGMSKAQLSALLASLNRLQYSVYSVYTQGLIAELKAFMSADLTVNQQVWATSYNSYAYESDDILDPAQSRKFMLGFAGPKPAYGISAVSGNDNALWSKIINSPVPANGLLLPAFVSNYGSYAQSSVLNAVRKAYANNVETQALIEEIQNETPQGTSGIMQTLTRNGASLLATAFQHVSSIVAMGVSSVFFPYYGWVSVMDSHTTAICASRNGNIYRAGEGPLPPAHYNCRSHTVPIVGNSASDLPRETFYQWTQAQPKVVQDEVKAGFVPLSVAGFIAKVPKILTR